MSPGQFCDLFETVQTRGDCHPAPLVISLSLCYIKGEYDARDGGPWREGFPRRCFKSEFLRARGSMDRATDYGSVGWGFKSLRARQFFSFVSSGALRHPFFPDPPSPFLRVRWP